MQRLLRLAQREEVVHGTVRSTTGEGNSLPSTSGPFPAGAPGHKYLPSDLNVHKMHELFEPQNHAQTSYSIYYSVFSKDLNLGIGHPATDACSDCAKFMIRITDPNLTGTEKRTESASFILHHRRACMFYDLLGRVEDHVTLCFDMMQNMVLPKTPTGQAY